MEFFITFYIGNKTKLKLTNDVTLIKYSLTFILFFKK